jgi:hypothetical protein
MILTRRSSRTRDQGMFETGQSLGEAAIANFFQHGLEKYVRDDQAALLLFEDADIRSVFAALDPRTRHYFARRKRFSRRRY